MNWSCPIHCLALNKEKDDSGINFPLERKRKIPVAFTWETLKEDHFSLGVSATLDSIVRLNCKCICPWGIKSMAILEFLICPELSTPLKSSTFLHFPLTLSSHKTPGVCCFHCLCVCVSVCVVLQKSFGSKPSYLSEGIKGPYSTAPVSSRFYEHWMQTFYASAWASQGLLLTHASCPHPLQGESTEALAPPLTWCQVEWDQGWCLPIFLCHLQLLDLGSREQEN